MDAAITTSQPFSPPKKTRVSFLRSVGTQEQSLPVTFQIDERDEPQYILEDTYGMYLTSQAQLKVFIPSVFFKNKMMVKGRRPEQRKYDSDSAKCWTKGLDIHVVNRVILPMLRGTDHWCCYLVDMDSEQIIEYDSHPANMDNNRVTALRRWVSDESAKSRGEQHRLNTVKWKARVGVCPQQSNGYDCGVFVACLMRSLAMNMPFTFSQGTIDIERANIALHLLKYFATTNPNRAVGSVEE
eukprot:gb/GECG01014495.1/.p1 GENE.gb/GECG01014495.1/~~gb/GECG01014495.1/.p1  ORF type:complete len:241 (+),score=15.58 gb/GECG01014495.1/:1-723(+)